MKPHQGGFVQPTDAPLVGESTPPSVLPWPVAGCAYCDLPATVHDPFGDAPCCRVDFELLAGALDFDHQPTADELMRTLIGPAFTTDEFKAWADLLDERYPAGWRQGSSAELGNRNKAAERAIG